MTKPLPKIGECYIICGRPFMILPCVDDGKPRCYHCSMSDYALPRMENKNTGGKYAVDEKQLYVHCRARKSFQCDRPSMKCKIVLRVACPMIKKEVEAYVREVEEENKAIQGYKKP